MAPDIRCPVWRILDSHGESLDLSAMRHREPLDSLILRHMTREIHRIVENAQNLDLPLGRTSVGTE